MEKSIASGCHPVARSYWKEISKKMTKPNDISRYLANWQKEIDGAAITLLTGRSVWYSGFRQVIIGLVAAGLVYGIGRLIGVSVAG